MVRRVRSVSSFQHSLWCRAPVVEKQVSVCHCNNHEVHLAFPITHYGVEPFWIETLIADVKVEKYSIKPKPGMLCTRIPQSRNLQKTQCPFSPYASFRLPNRDGEGSQRSDLFRSMYFMIFTLYKRVSPTTSYCMLA